MLQANNLTSQNKQSVSADRKRVKACGTAMNVVDGHLTTNGRIDDQQRLRTSKTETNTTRFLQHLASNWSVRIKHWLSNQSPSSHVISTSRSHEHRSPVYSRGIPIMYSGCVVYDFNFFKLIEYIEKCNTTVK